MSSPAIEELLTRWRPRSPSPHRQTSSSTQRPSSSHFSATIASSSSSAAVVSAAHHSHAMPQPPPDDEAHVTMLDGNTIITTNVNNSSSSSSSSSITNNRGSSSSTTPSKWCTHCQNHHPQQPQTPASTSSSSTSTAASASVTVANHIVDAQATAHRLNANLLTAIVVSPTREKEEHQKHSARLDDRLEYHHLINSNQEHHLPEAMPLQELIDSTTTTGEESATMQHLSKTTAPLNMSCPPNDVDGGRQLSCSSCTETSSSTTSSSAATSSTPQPSKIVKTTNSCSSNIRSGRSRTASSCWPHRPARRIGFTIVTAILSALVVLMLANESGVSAASIRVQAASVMARPINITYTAPEQHTRGIRSTQPLPLPESMKPDAQGRECNFCI